MSALDRYLLAQALLSGDASARWVLADLLEEQGDGEAAVFARRTRASREGHLDVAIRQLPCPDVALLGCEFIEHAADDKLPALQSQLARVRRLLRRGGSLAQSAAACCGLSDFRTVRRAWYDEPLTLLDDAVHSLAAAVAAACQPAAEARVGAAVAVTSCARSLRALRQQQYRVKHKPKELDWQIKQTQRLLSELAARAECTSP